MHKQCKACGGTMIRELLDGPDGTRYVAWVCTKCGCEEKA